MEEWEEEREALHRRAFSELESRLEQTATVSRELGRSLRGLPADEIARRITREIEARGWEPDEAIVGSIARQIAHPFPVTGRRDRRQWEEQERERIRQHNKAMEADDRARLVEAFGEDEADAMLFSDTVDEAVDLAVSQVMDRLDVACSWSLRPPRSHDGVSYLVQVRPWSRGLARRIRRAVDAVGQSVDVRPQ